jgi:hypothetical protein
MAAPAATAAAHTEESLRRLSAAPGNRVLAWAEPGERRADALSAEQVEALIGRLQGEVVDTVASRPGMNELMLRMELGGRRVGPPAPENYTWADFAAYYPTFWGKITSASATRRDMMTIAAMVAARREFEAGRSSAADERELEALIQSDILALNMESAGRGERDAASAPRQRGQPGDNSPQVRRALEQARLRRLVLERQLAGVRVPTEELAALGAAFAPARSCIHEIIEEEKQRAKGEKKAEKKGAKAGKAAPPLPPLPPPVVRFARRMLELRVNIAKDRGAMPEELEPKGATFMPTYVRSAQLELAWREDAWVPPPQEIEA